jgi:hypothetical protein
MQSISAVLHFQNGNSLCSRHARDAESKVQMDIDTLSGICSHHNSPGTAQFKHVFVLLCIHMSHVICLYFYICTISLQLYLNLHVVQ